MKYMKYTYQGISLYTYCNEHNIKKYTIYGRIKKLKKTNPDLTDTELVEEALNRNFKEENTIYFFNGTTLHKYCFAHPEIKYCNLCNWLNKELKKNPHQSVEDLIKAYLNGINNKNRWYYLGIPLREFCVNNAISYDSIRAYLFKMLRNPMYSNWDDEDLVSYLVERRFKINGLQLKKYCFSINFPYDVMHNILKQELEKHPDLNFCQILHTTITAINSYRLTNYGNIIQQAKEIKTYLENSNYNIRHQEEANFLKLQR